MMSDFVARRPKLMRYPVAVAATVSLFMIITKTLEAAPAFTGGVGGISMGVADLGAPVNPGAPLYLFNNFNLRNDILINPGLGLTADLSIPNNTLSTGAIPFAPGQFIWAQQIGGGNANGPFGAGGAVIRGDQFGFYLQDGGIPGGVSASYQIMSWDANFFDAAGTAVGALGTFIAISGHVPLVQDLALVSLRVELNGPNIGVVEMPGLIIGIERTGPASFAPIIIQDGLGGAATPMPWGGAVIVDNVATGAFRALIYNVLPDLGVIDGLAIPAGEAFSAAITATTITDPADSSFFDIFAELSTNTDLVTAAQALNGVSLPSQSLAGFAQVPEVGSLTLACGVSLVVSGWVFVSRRRGSVS